MVLYKNKYLFIYLSIQIVSICIGLSNETLEYINCRLYDETHCSEPKIDIYKEDGVPGLYRVQNCNEFDYSKQF